jgi:hypothetical protein
LTVRPDLFLVEEKGEEKGQKKKGTGYFFKGMLNA